MEEDWLTVEFVKKFNTSIESIKQHILEYYCNLRFQQRNDKDGYCDSTKNEGMCPIAKNIMNSGYAGFSEERNEAITDCDFNSRYYCGNDIDKAYSFLPDKIKEKFKPLIEAAKFSHTEQKE